MKQSSATAGPAAPVRAVPLRAVRPRFAAAGGPGAAAAQSQGGKKSQREKRSRWKRETNFPALQNLPEAASTAAAGESRQFPRTKRVLNDSDKLIVIIKLCGRIKSLTNKGKAS